MNRFFRSALFPLVVIVLLVYLASQTLIPKRDNAAKLTYSELITQAKQGNVSEVKFNPNRQSINATLDSGQKVKVNYPTPQSQIQFQDVLRRTTSSSTPRAPAPRPGWRSSPGCCRSCSSSASGSS